MDPFQLEWTKATIEHYSSELKAAVHVFNHDLATPEAMERTLRFAAGRARWFRHQLPQGTSQAAWLDDRGQDIDPVFRRHLQQPIGRDFVR